MKKTLIWLFVTIAAISLMFILAFWGINSLNSSRSQLDEEEMDRIIVRNRQALFSLHMRFDNNSGYSTFDVLSVMVFDPKFDDIVFVETWQEGLGANLDESTIVAWPTPYTYGVLQHLNNDLREREINWSDYDLVYPITMQDVIFNWGLVHEVFLMYDAPAPGLYDFLYEQFRETHQSYLEEIAATRRERGIPEPVRWRPPWEE